MISPSLFAAATILIALILYALSGGADYGGGVWDLLARGPRAKAQRDLIAHAIAPIWEANHVWLILAIVVLFTAFPPAFAAIATSLHIPLMLALIGIVLRGSAFIFRAYATGPTANKPLWQRVFAISSLVTPFLLGMSAGAIAAGRVHPAYGFVDSWVALLPTAVGLYSVALFAYLAAVHLSAEKAAPILNEDFRRRAMWSGLAVALIGLWVARLWISSPIPLRNRPTVIAIQVLSEASAVAAMLALWKQRYRLAQLGAALQTALIFIGWGAAQYPLLLPPDLSLENSAAPEATLRLLEKTLVLGALVLFPSFIYLFFVFKHRGGESQPPSKISIG